MNRVQKDLERFQKFYGVCEAYILESLSGYSLSTIPKFVTELGALHTEWIAVTMNATKKFNIGVLFGIYDPYKDVREKTKAFLVKWNLERSWW